MSQTEVQLIKDAVIVNADISNSAAIDISKISGAMPLAGGAFTDDVTFTGASANIVFDKSSNELLFADNAKASFGNNGDLVIKHTGSASVIEDNGTGPLNIQTNNSNINIKGGSSAGDTMAIFKSTEGVELYYDNVKTFSTDGNGIFAFGPEGGTANVYIYADEGDDDADKWSLTSGTDGTFTINNRASGSFEKNIECNGNGNVELYFDSSKKLETTSSGITVTGSVVANGISRSSGNLSINNNDTSNGVITFATNTNDCWRFEFNGDFEPHVDNQVNIGSATKRVANVFTTDLHLSNKGSQNDVDSTWGDYTIQEGLENLFLINHRTGKKFKFNLTEVA